MTKIIAQPSASNGAATPLPLLEYGERVRIRALPRAARRLAQRYGLPPSTACAVASAAGFHMEASR